MMVHSLSYPTDNSRQPDREEISREAERLHDVAVEMKKHRAYLSATCILNYSNTQYNN